MEERLLTVAELADLLSVRPSWVYRALERGVLPSRRLGRYRRFVPAEIKTWLEMQRGVRPELSKPTAG